MIDITLSCEADRSWLHDPRLPVLRTLLRRLRSLPEMQRYDHDYGGDINVHLVDGGYHAGSMTRIAPVPGQAPNGYQIRLDMDATLLIDMREQRRHMGINDAPFDCMIQWMTTLTQAIVQSCELIAAPMKQHAPLLTLLPLVSAIEQEHEESSLEIARRWMVQTAYVMAFRREIEAQAALFYALHPCPAGYSIRHGRPASYR